jgi:hypothetical protein
VPVLQMGLISDGGQQWLVLMQQQRRRKAGQVRPVVT